MNRKVLLVMPVLVIPFVTLAFFALGGGRGAAMSASEVKDGLNLKVPDAKLPNEISDKLGFYARADKDSSKMKEWMKADPYYKRDALSFDAMRDEDADVPMPLNPSRVAPEDELVSKITRLQQSMQVNAAYEHPSVLPERPSTPAAADVERLEAMLRQFQDKEEDPSMRQISDVMDKILDVQYPERMQQTHVPIDSTLFYPVRLHALHDTLVDGFYSWRRSEGIEGSQTMAAVVNEDQVITHGAVLKLRLLQDVFIGAHKVPSGNFVVGECNWQGERLAVVVTSIRAGANLLPVKLRVYDIDGLAGIAVPGGMTRDVAKQSADKNLQSLGIGSLDPSLKAQATTAGLQAAKSLLSRKVKQVKVMVKAGYKVLLQDEGVK